MSIAMLHALTLQAKQDQDDTALLVAVPSLAALIARKTLDKVVHEYRAYAMRIMAHNRAYPEAPWQQKGLKQFLLGWRSYWWLADWYAFLNVRDEHRVELVHQTNAALVQLFVDRYGWSADSEIGTYRREGHEGTFAKRTWRLCG